MIEKIIIPKLSALMKKGRVVEINVKEGQTVKKGETILWVNAEKANAEIEAKNDGYISIQCEVDKEYEVGTTIAYIGSSLEELESVQSEVHIDIKTRDSTYNNKIDYVNKKSIRALPIAKRLAKEHDIDLTTIKGSGSNGMITKEDVENFINIKKESNEIMDLDPIKKSMFDHMELTKDYVKGTTFMEIDLHLVKQARINHKHSYTSYLAAAVAESLAKYPILNSSYQDGKILLNKQINLGIALDNEGKLIVPVIKNARNMGVKEIEECIKSFQEKARNNNISIDDLVDGTFTLTNSGIFGSLCFAPIINYPQSAIMGMGMIVDRAVVYDNAIAIRPIMIISLSYDHRIIEGSVAVKFLASVKEILENPSNYDI